MTGGFQLMELLENAFSRRRVVQCLSYFVPFDKDPLVWDHPRCWTIMQHVLSTWHKTVTWLESVLLHGNSIIVYKCSLAEPYSTRLCFSSFWSSLDLD